MKIVLLLISIGLFISACHQPASEQSHRQRQGDSTEIVKLLRTVYKWHDKNQGNLEDFPIIVKDSFQVGIRFDSLKRTIDALKQTGYFSSGFIENYKKMADSFNYRMRNANPKLLNEVNFGFQDADIWTGFQDSAGDYWNTMTIQNFKATADSASLSWKLRENGWTSDPYAVGFTFENGKWRVAYLQGFEISHQ